MSAFGKAHIHTKKLPPGTQPGGRPERHVIISLDCNRKRERRLPIAVERMVGPQYLPVRDTNVLTKTLAVGPQPDIAHQKPFRLITVSRGDRCLGSCDGNTVPNLLNGRIANRPRVGACAILSTIVSLFLVSGETQEYL